MQLCSFATRIDLCNYHQNQDREHTHHPRKLLVLPLLSHTLSHTLFLATTDLFLVATVLPFLECHTDGIIQYVIFEADFFHVPWYI